MAVQSLPIDRKAIIKDIWSEFPRFAEKCLRISTKRGSVVPLQLNQAQLHLHARIEDQLRRTGMVRMVVSKGRQQGISTYTEGRFYWRVTSAVGKKAFILTHEREATDNLFDMVSRYHDHMPKAIKPHTGASNAKELYFDKIESGYKIGTAGNKAVGRGSTIQYLHACLGEDAPVVDADTGRIVRIKDVEAGLNVLTHNGNIAPVTYKSKKQKKCLSVKMRGLAKFPLVATPEHKFWTKDGWKELADMSAGDEIGYPVKKITDTGTSFRVDSYVPVRKQHGGRHSKSSVEKIESDFKWGRALGLYLAEGSIKRQYSGDKLPSAVVFTVHAKEVERTVEWLSWLDGVYSSLSIKKLKDSLSRQIILYGANVSRTFEGICGAKDEKRLPDEWWMHGKEFSRGLLVGYLSGDGGVDTKCRRIIVTSIREAITLGMRDVSASLGYGWASVEFKEAAVRHGRNEKAAYKFVLCGDGVVELGGLLGVEVPARKREKSQGRIGNAPTGTEISGGYAWLRVRSLEDAGIRDVYDLEIGHDDHSYCLLHGATHNSEMAYWENAENQLSGLLQAVPREPGTEIIIESTSNGVGGVYYDYANDADEGKGSFEICFIPWYWQDEYRMGVPEDFSPDEEEQFLKSEYGLDDAQLVWRRDKIHELKDPEIFRQEYPFTLKESFVASGRGAFARKWLQKAFDECYSPAFRAEVLTSTGEIVDRSDGELLVWDKPQPGRRYFIGADPAEGLAKGDYSALQVLDDDGNQVAEYRAHVEPDTFADVIAAIGKYYNRAIAGVERNNHGQLTLYRLAKQLGYPKVFTQLDTEYQSSDKMTKKYGWLTTSRTKPLMIDYLISVVRDEMCGAVSKALVNEMETYVVDERGRYNAVSGKHDDLLMAFAIAHQMHIMNRKKKHAVSSPKYAAADSRAGF